MSATCGRFQSSNFYNRVTWEYIIYQRIQLYKLLIPTRFFSQTISNNLRFYKANKFLTRTRQKALINFICAHTCIELISPKAGITFCILFYFSLNSHLISYNFSLISTGFVPDYFCQDPDIQELSLSWVSLRKWVAV